MNLKKILAMGVTMLTLLSCNKKDNKDLIKYIDSIKQQKHEVIKPLPSFKLIKPFTIPEGDFRRNPFKPKSKIAIFNKKTREPLEYYSLDEIKFVGILSQNTKIWGLIKTPNDEIFKVTLGSFMGQHKGKVSAISENELKVEEQFQLNDGLQKVVKIIKLSQEGKMVGFKS